MSPVVGQLFRHVVQVLLRRDDVRKMEPLGVRSADFHPSGNRATVGDLQAITFFTIFGTGFHG
jgi:hypothetical protein